MFVINYVPTLKTDYKTRLTPIYIEDDDIPFNIEWIEEESHELYNEHSWEME